MIFDGHVHQLPDIDPTETKEWLDSLDAVVDTHGKTRARYLLTRLMERATESQVSFPATVSTPYVNTIPREGAVVPRRRAHRAPHPGLHPLERRDDGRAGEQDRPTASAATCRPSRVPPRSTRSASTTSSAARTTAARRPHLLPGPRCAPGVYARAFLEGRLTEDDLDHFRMRDRPGWPGLSSYPHPRLMPDFWEFPTVSMGLGPINALYHARFNRYLQNRASTTPAQPRLGFLGDGETDEPETLGAISLAGTRGTRQPDLRRQLQPAAPRRPRARQRQDHPGARGHLPGRRLERDQGDLGLEVGRPARPGQVDGVLLNKMNTTVDGEFQRYAVESGAYIREHFFGPDPRLRKMVEHLSDDEMRNLPRGGHDYRKLYAAYKAAAENLGRAPTVILAKTVKGWTLGPVRGSQLHAPDQEDDQGPAARDLRDRLHLHDEIPDESALDADMPPYFRPARTRSSTST
jgi:pyruvate dehydrogenase E1 component